MTKPDNDVKRGRAKYGSPGVSPGGNEPSSALFKDSGKGEAQTLESWKEIAAFIGRDLRTAHRWERERGMPVRRVPGGRGSRVSASKAEITEWLRSIRETEVDPEPNAGITDPSSGKVRLALRTVAITAAILALASVPFIVANSLRPTDFPARVQFGESSVEALDSGGHRLWAYRFGRVLDLSIFANHGGPHAFVRIADLLGDGRREVVLAVPYRLGKDPGDRAETAIVCLSQNGKLLWSYVPRRAFRFGDHDLRGPWLVESVLLSNAADHAVWIAFSHADWGDSYVSKFDPKTGQETVRYVNTGTVRVLSELQAGRTMHLLAGGFNNEYDGPSLAVIDEHGGFAASPQTPGTRHKCVSCPPGDPEQYFVFPRSEMNRASKVYEDAVWGIGLVEGGFVASIRDLQVQSVDIKSMYQFSSYPDFRPVTLQFSSTYVEKHRELERVKLLDHPLESCPERLHPLPVRMWTKAGGWAEVPLKPVD